MPTPISVPHSSCPPKIITTTEKNFEKLHEIDTTTNVHGYIACSSENNAIEINLRFPKCKCPESCINHKTETDARDDVDVINSEEIKTKIINFDRNNLRDIVENLDINTCTKCTISSEVKRLLTRIFSNPALNHDTNGSCRSFMGDGASLLSASISPRFSETNVSATTDHDDFIIFNLNKQHKRHSSDKRSTGTQHEDLSFCDNKSPNNPKNKEVYVITDEFKKKCTEHHIIVKQKNMKSQKKKHPFSRSLENLATPEVQRKEFTNVDEKKLVNGKNGVASVKKPPKISETKTRSKSVDDISTSSNEMLEGVDSVELIFISDEFLNKSIKEEPEVIIVDDPSKHPSPRPTPSPNNSQVTPDDKLLVNGKSSKKTGSNKSNRDKSPKDKKLYVISDDYKKRSLNNTVIVVKQREKKKNTKVDSPPKNDKELLSLNLTKTTATNSNTFLTYEEPFSPIYDLEDKKIP